MIKYALRCARGHAFESWFQSSAAFDALAGARQLDCPVCGDRNIEKRLMAPSIGRAAASEEAAAPEPSPAAASPASTPPAPSPAPDALVAAAPEVRRRVIEGRLRALRAYVEASAEAVGDGFAAEARRIHEGEAPARPIYGQATPEEVESLADDDIQVLRIPWVDRRDD